MGNGGNESKSDMSLLLGEPRTAFEAAHCRDHTPSAAGVV
jgi:hypothetical protein